MDKRASLILQIQRSIAFFEAMIILNRKTRRSDILIEAEEVSRNLLNMTFGYDLKPLHQTSRNTPEIDMSDDARRIAVQVTGSNTRAQVQNTLTHFLEHELDQQYDMLLVFIPVTDSKFRQRVDFSVPDGMELKIMTFVDLIRELEHADTECLERIAGYLERVIGLGAPGRSSEAAPALVNPDAVFELSETGAQVLRLADYLPAEGLERNVFEHGLAPAQRKALPDLLERGVLYQQEQLLFLHPDVRKYAQLWAAADHALFLDRLWDYEKSWHWDRVSLTREIALKKSLAQIYERAADHFPERAVVYALRSAELYRDTQQYAQALDPVDNALHILESDQKDLWGAARAHHFAGECSAALQHHEYALMEWEKTLTLCRDQLPASEVDIAEAHHNVGRALTALERYEDAERELLNALKLLEDFRKTCPDFAPQPWMTEIYDSLAAVYTKRDMDLCAALCSKNALHPPAEQEELWQSLSMQTQHTLDKDENDQAFEAVFQSVVQAAKLNNAGYASAARGDYVQALEHLMKAYAIQEKVLPPDHPDIAGTYENMGYTYGDLGNYENALEYHTKARTIREKALAPEHPDIARSCHNIAWAYRDMGDYQRAREYMHRTVDIAERSLPEGHPDRIKYRTDLEDLERDIRQ